MPTTDGGHDVSAHPSPSYCNMLDMMAKSACAPPIGPSATDNTVHGACSTADGHALLMR